MIECLNILNIVNVTDSTGECFFTEISHGWYLKEPLKQFSKKGQFRGSFGNGQNDSDDLAIRTESFSNSIKGPAVCKKPISPPADFYCWTLSLAVDFQLSTLSDFRSFNLKCSKTAFLTLFT